MLWDSEREQALAELWDRGLTGTEIVRRLPGTTRSMIMGKARRMGLSHRAASGGRQGSKPGHKRKRKQDSGGLTPLPDRAAVVPIPHASLPPLDLSNAVTLEQLEPRHCRWPLDDGRYCGHTRAHVTVSFCRQHMAVAYQVLPLVCRQKG